MIIANIITMAKIFISVIILLSLIIKLILS
jgi:hypothetical protein